MRDVNAQNFGFLIAFLLPGFIILAGLSQISTDAAILLGAGSTPSPTIGGFLYGTLVAILAGLMASTVRWLVLDQFHHFTGLKAPDWNFGRLQASAEAFDVVKQDQYRFYQFYGNSMVAFLFADICLHIDQGFWPQWFDLGILLLIGLCFLGSRDTLKKYYSRVNAALS